MKVYLALFRNNLRLTTRDRSVFVFNFLFPFIFFFAFAELFHAGTGQGVAFFVATALVMGIMGNGLWGAGARRAGARGQYFATIQGDAHLAAADPDCVHGERLAALSSGSGVAGCAGALQVRNADTAELAVALPHVFGGRVRVSRHRPDSGL